MYQRNNKDSLLFFGIAVVLAIGIAYLLPACSSATNASAAFRPVNSRPTNLVKTTNSATTSPNYATVQGSAVSSTVSGESKVSSETRSIKEITIPLSRAVPIEGEVGENATSGAFQIAALNKVSNAPIFVILESPGGSVLHGAQLISAMQASKAPVYTVCRTMCASMAFMIFEYGTKRYATDRTTLMAHPASASAEGRVDNMVNFAKYLQRLTAKMEVDVAQRMGITFDQYKAKVVNEYWIDAEDGIKDGAADELVSLKLNDDMNLFSTTPSPQEKIKISRVPFKFDIRWITE